MNIIVAIGGGIAAYKTLWLIRLLKKENHQVKVILTQNAMHFVTVTSVETLSENPVCVDLWSTSETSSHENEHNMHHISLAKWADFIVIAPATANRISLLAQGNCQDLLGNVIMASKVPLAIAPAMNRQMWENPAVQKNISILKERNVEIFGPARGSQACGDVGEGRLLEPEEMMAEIDRWVRPMTPTFSHLLITAGSTQEPIDPVRYISNSSSGRMGIEIANYAYQCGIDVTLVYADINPKLLDGLASNIKRVCVQTAQQMLVAVENQIHQGRVENKPYEMFIACAAVSDYRPAQYSEQKIKKTNENSFTLELMKNPDIIRQVALDKKEGLPYCAGFALESENLLQNAEKKLKEKKMDIIFANPVNSINAQLSSITALWQVGENMVSKDFSYDEKSENAKYVLQLLCQNYVKNLREQKTI